MLKKMFCRYRRTGEVCPVISRIERKLNMISVRYNMEQALESARKFSDLLQQPIGAKYYDVFVIGHNPLIDGDGVYALLGGMADVQNLNDDEMLEAAVDHIQTDPSMVGFDAYSVLVVPAGIGAELDRPSEDDIPW